jgi:hypothetical protein
MRLWLLALAGCWSTQPTPLAEHTSSASSGLVITANGFGPIDGKTVATLQSLRTLLPFYKIVPNNDPTLQYDIYRGTERLGFVILNDDATVFNVHATSNKVVVADRPWRAGEAFQGAKQIDTCECWGANPTCYRKGEHVAVNFNRSCLESNDIHELRALDGLVIQRVIWSPTELGKPDPDPAQDPGGDDEDGN